MRDLAVLILLLCGPSDLRSECEQRDLFTGKDDPTFTMTLCWQSAPVLVSAYMQRNPGLADRPHRWTCEPAWKATNHDI